LDTRGRVTRAAVVFGLSLATTQARAQADEQRAGARAAATAGGRAFEEKHWAESVDYFSRAESLVHSPVHLLYMARAYEKLGALVKAREAYIRITNEELAPNAPQPMRDAKKDAQKELDALEPRVPYVSVVVQGAGPKPVTVTMDGAQVPPALVGVPRPVDPGEHKFEAMSEGMDSAVSSIAVREGRSETVVLTLHPAAAGAAPPPPVAGPAPVTEGQPMMQPMPPPQPGPPNGAPPPPQADTGSHGPSPLTWVAFGVGAVGLGVGTVFALQSKSKADDATAQCNHPDPYDPAGPSDYCTQQGVSLADDARSARTIATVGFVVGGLGVAGGVTLLILTNKHQPAAATAFEPFIGLGSAGMRGRF